MIAKAAYSLYLDSSSSSEGSILFGGIDHAKYTGDLTTIDIVPKDGEYLYSQIPLSHIAASINNYTNASQDLIPTVLILEKLGRLTSITELIHSMVE